MKYGITENDGTWLLVDDAGPVRVGGYLVNGDADDWREVADAIASKAPAVEAKRLRFVRHAGTGYAVDCPDNPVTTAAPRMVSLVQAAELAAAITAALAGAQLEATRPTPAVRVLIMCQGQQRRLPALKGSPKHLLPIGDESILGRTLRLLAKLLPASTYTVTVVGPLQLATAVEAGAFTLVGAVAKPGSCVVTGIRAALEETRWPGAVYIGDHDAALLAATRAGRGQRTVVLLGDVVWSEAALAKVLADRRPIVFAGTPVLSASEGEVFALGFDDPQGMKRLCETCPCVATRYAQMQGGHLRRLLWHVQSKRGLRWKVAAPRGRPPVTTATPPSERQTWHPDAYLVIADWTDDVDTAADVARLPTLAALLAREAAS